MQHPDARDRRFPVGRRHGFWLRRPAPYKAAGDRKHGRDRAPHYFLARIASTLLAISASAKGTGLAPSIAVCIARTTGVITFSAKISLWRGCEGVYATNGNSATNARWNG